MLLPIVTKIPLDTAQRDEPEIDRERPRWIRPAQKKAPSKKAHSNAESNSSDSPEAFSPSEFFADVGTPQTLPHLPMQHLVSTLPGSAGNLDMNDPNNMFILSDDVMAIFNDGNVDMAALFQPEADFGLNGAGARFETLGQDNKLRLAFVSPS